MQCPPLPKQGQELFSRLPLGKIEKKVAVWKNKDADVTDGQEKRVIVKKKKVSLLSEFHVLPDYHIAK